MFLILLNVSFDYGQTTRADTMGEATIPICQLAG
jgi:hypothetical protein